MIQPDYNILNQRGTPMFFSDVFANRPTAGIVGRIFISTDTKEFYRDTGTTWELMGGPGAGTITGSGTPNTFAIFTGASTIGDSSYLTQSTNSVNLSNANLNLPNNNTISGTNYGLYQQMATSDYWKIYGNSIASDQGELVFEIGDNGFPISSNGQRFRFFYNAPSGGSNKNPFIIDYNLSSFNTQVYITDTQTYSTGTIQSQTIDKQLTIPNGASISGSVALTSQLVGGTTTFQGSTTIPNSTALSNNLISNSFAFSGAGTISMTQAAGIRAASSNGIQTYFSGTASSTISHYAANFIYGFYNINSGSITPVIQNAYMLLINDMNDYSHTFTFNNRWGIYQAGANDVNYFAANVLINTQVNSGEKLRVNGNVLIEAKVTANDSLLNTSYTGGGTAIIETWQRIGGAVAANMVYDDANTNMNFGTSTSHNFNIKTSNTNRITIKSNGPVGIGVTDPQATLHIGNSGATNLYIQSGSTSESIIRYFIGSNECVTTRADTNANYRIETGVGSPTEKMRLTGSTGNLLINTTTDSGFKLDVNGSSIIRGFLTTTDAIKLGSNSTAPSSTDAFIFRPNDNTLGFGTASAERMRITSGGNLLVGTTNDTGDRLYVNNTAYIGNSSGGLKLYGDGGSANIWTVIASPLRLGANNTEFIRITSSGNLLVGSTTDPGQKLYLNGSLRIDGQRSATAGGASGQHLIIDCDGTTYKIALLNP